MSKISNFLKKLKQAGSTSIFKLILPGIQTQRKAPVSSKQVP